MLFKRRFVKLTAVFTGILIILVAGYYFMRTDPILELHPREYTGPKVDYYNLPTPKKEEYRVDSQTDEATGLNLNSSLELIEANKKIFKCYSDEEDGQILVGSQILEKHGVRVFRGFPLKNKIFLHYRCPETKVKNFFILQPNEIEELVGDPTLVDNVIAWNQYDEENDRVPVAVFKTKDDSLINNQFVAAGEDAKKILVWHPAFVVEDDSDYSTEMPDGFSKSRQNVFYSIPTMHKNFVIENWSKRVNLEYTTSVCTNILSFRDNNGKHTLLQKSEGGDCDHGEPFTKILGIISIKDETANEEWLVSMSSGSEDESVKLTPIKNDGQLDSSNDESLLFNKY